MCAHEDYQEIGHLYPKELSALIRSDVLCMLVYLYDAVSLQAYQ